MIPGFAAVQRVTADAVVGTSGAPTVVWSVTVNSGTSPTITLRNGTAATDTALFDPATATAPTHFDFPNGMHFPAGCYADVGGTSPVVTITYNTMATS